MLFAFVDTNVILHYRPVAEIDWRKVCGEKAVTIMLCMPVIDELDRKKSDPRLGQRAKDRIRDLQQRSGKTIRPNVTLQIYHDPEDDSGVGDRGIAKIVAAYRDREGAKVAVITEDWGMMQRCEGLAVPWVTPPEQQRLPDDEGEDKKEIRKLRRQVLEFQNKQPKLDLTYSPSQTQELTRPHLPTVAEQMQAYVNSIKRGHRFDAHSTQNQVYLRSIQEWLENDHRIADESARTVMLKVAIKNNGNAPAEGVDLTITFPDSIIKAVWFDHWLDGDRARQVRVPQELAYFEKSLPPPSTPIPHNLGQQNHSLPIYGRVSQRVFTAPIQMLAHGDERSFPEFFLTFRSWEDVRPFAADVSVRTLSPANLEAMKIPVKAKIVAD